MSRRSAILFVLLCIIWGIPYFFIRIAVSDITPATLVFMRTAIGALILLPVAAARREILPALRRWWPVLAYTVAEMAVPWFFLSSAETKIPSALSGLLIAAVPSVATVVSLVFGFERPDRRRVLGLAIGLAGVAALVGLDLRTGDTSAFLEMLLVTTGYAVGPLIVARRLSDVPSLGVVALSLALCAIGYTLPGIREMPHTLPPTDVLWAIGVLGVVCTAVGFLVAFALIAGIGPVRMTVVTYVNPAVALLLGVAALHESLTLGMAVGFVVILLGSYVTTRPLKTEGTPVERAVSTT